MPPQSFATLDGNEAVARVAYQLSEAIAIYPITPASPMGEWADAWAAAHRPNLWGTVPAVFEMQSEGGVAGAIHGALQAGALATTFTASQGLLLTIPNLYKIAGELTATVWHVAARSIATQALSIFGDHSDVMAVRSTGCALLCSSSVQEAQDLAAIATRATLGSRIPFLHFFDGFRTSHEIQKVALLDDRVLQEMIPSDWIAAHRARALTPDRPVIRGTAQNPDVYFQAREAVNQYYADCPVVVQQAMDLFAQLTGRQYHLFDYYGDRDADRVIVLMGSGCETVQETVDALNAQGAKVGVVKVRLYRPFDVQAFVAALPPTVESIAVLDRTKEPGSIGEPLYQDVVSALFESNLQIRAIGGRYGLSSKEFTPAMVKAIYDHLAVENPKRHFTIGIQDDVTHTSLEFDPSFCTESDRVVRAIFYGLGADGTVGANKNSIKIIGEETANYAQGYFVYDSKKSGSVTVSHLRFGPDPIHSTYLVTSANFIACHQWQFVEKFDALAGVLPRDEAIDRIKQSIRKTYSKKGESVVAMNLQAVDRTLENLHPVRYSTYIATETPQTEAVKSWVPDTAPVFVRDVLAPMMARQGDNLPVSVLPVDGTYPSGTAQWEKRYIAQEVPVWEPDVCVQCGKCVMVCPHAVIRAKVLDPAALESAPATFRTSPARDPDWANLQFTLQISAADCTGCGICVDVCPAKNKAQPRQKAINMAPQNPLREQEAANWDFFLNLPNPDRSDLNLHKISHQQMQEPLFEFSGACAGCGETPYIKLATQLFGDRMLVANATGCSSIYGGSLPTTPWTHNTEGRGPAWSNSLFEDNAEFGLGFRVAIDKQAEYAQELLQKLTAEGVNSSIPSELATAILTATQTDEADIVEQRQRVTELKQYLTGWQNPDDSLRQTIQALQGVADYLVKKSVWLIGGDGWAYDIGYGGLDHVLASGRNVNILVLDTEVYSNTGGQMSKSTPRAAVAKFASGGKPGPKKDLGLMAMTYGNAYVASVAMGARDEHTLRVFLEAESYDGPSLIIAYSHCIAHGIDMQKGLQQQKAMVDSGRWLLYRYDPRRTEQGENPLILDSRSPKISVEQAMYSENRFKMLTRSNPDEAKRLAKLAQSDADTRWQLYQALAARSID
jgi:pyruvate-ferredoxin/flavodoxin oxidoreductase